MALVLISLVRPRNLESRDELHIDHRLTGFKQRETIQRRFAVVHPDNVASRARVGDDHARQEVYFFVSSGECGIFCSPRNKQ